MNRKDFISAILALPAAALAAVKREVPSLPAFQPMKRMEYGGWKYAIFAPTPNYRPFTVVVGRRGNAEETLQARAVHVFSDGHRRVYLADGSIHSYSPSAYFEIAPESVGIVSTTLQRDAR